MFMAFDHGHGMAQGRVECESDFISIVTKSLTQNRPQYYQCQGTTFTGKVILKYV